MAKYKVEWSQKNSKGDTEIKSTYVKDVNSESEAKSVFEKVCAGLKIKVKSITKVK